MFDYSQPGAGRRPTGGGRAGARGGGDAWLGARSDAVGCAVCFCCSDIAPRAGAPPPRCTIRISLLTYCSCSVSRLDPFFCLSQPARSRRPASPARSALPPQNTVRACVRSVHAPATSQRHQPADVPHPCPARPHPGERRCARAPAGRNNVPERAQQPTCLETLPSPTAASYRRPGAAQPATLRAHPHPKPTAFEISMAHTASGAASGPERGGSQRGFVILTRPPPPGGPQGCILCQQSAHAQGYTNRRCTGSDKR